MALRFLIQTLTPVERMTASLCFRHFAGVKATSAGSTLPERPKKPSTGYVQFVADTIPKLKQQMPGARGSDVLVKASGLWKELDAATKKRYNDAYTINKDKWMAEMARFEASLSAQTRDQLMIEERKAREQRREDREKRQRRKQFSEHQKPKKPSNAFMLYMQERQPTRGERSQREFVTTMSKEWAAKTDTEKAPYVKRYADAKDQYFKDLEVWEKQMIKQGRIDLVRTASQPMIDIGEVPSSRR